MERDGQIVNVREKGELNHLYDGSPVQIVTIRGGKKQKNQKQGRKSNGKRGETKMRKDRKKEKNGGSCKFPSTY